MAYYDKVPWHRLGQRVPKGVTAEEMIKAAGLDWKVELRPARGAKPINSKGEYARYEIIRVPRQGVKENEVLYGVVSKRYHPLQNIDAFRFFDPILYQSSAHYETAGALGEGERIWVMAKMPSTMTIVKGDDCEKYLLLSNNHTGNGSILVKFTTVRVVCQNTLMLAMKNGHKAFSVRHSKGMGLKLEELSEFLMMVESVYKKAEEDFKRLAKVAMVKDRLTQYLEAVYPATQAQKKNNEIPQRWLQIQEGFESRKDLQFEGVRGTLWGAYNAITAYEDYRQPQSGEMESQRLDRVWYGSGADIKLKALEAATKLAISWN